MPSPSSAAPRLNWLLVLGVFAIAAATLITRAVVSAGHTPLFGDTDDAMRMVVVRDFIHGQNWYDIVQHRLNTPFGAEVHWSRLVDLPIATIILIATPFAFGHAELVAAYLWPLLLLAILLWLSARLALRLVGPDGVLPALVLPVLSPAVTAEFIPGRIDHHNVQIILTLAIAWASVEAVKRPRFAWLAGLFCATALAIGTEAVPAVAAAILAFALLWVWSPEQARTLRIFGLAFAGAALVHLAIALPPQRWLVPACDALSIFYVGAALAVGVLFTTLSLVPERLSAPLPRLTLAAAGGLVAVAAVLAIDPTCIRGPYGAVDPWLTQHWLNNIGEVKTWWTSLAEIPDYTIAVTVPVVVALITMLVRIIRVPDERSEWLMLLVFALFATLVVGIQIRGARLVVMPMIPAAAWLIVSARQRYLAKRTFADVAALVSSWLAFSGIVLFIAIALIVANLPGKAQQMMAARDDREPCLMPAAFAQLNTLPPQRLMTPIDLGSHTLLETPHAVVSAPYHRDGQGVRDTFDFFNQPIDKARQILASRGVSLVVTCAAMPEMTGMADAAQNSFVKLAASNALPSWLTRISTGGPLTLYAVRPQ